MERPSTIASSRERPVLVLVGVRSMITVTYLSPWRVWRQTCSSTPIVATPSRRDGSVNNNSWARARIASLQVFHATPRIAAILAIESRSITMCLSANITASRDNLPRPGAAAAMGWRHTRAQPVHR